MLTGLKEEEVEVVVTQKAGQARHEYVTYYIFPPKNVLTKIKTFRDV